MSNAGVLSQAATKSKKKHFLSLKMHFSCITSALAKAIDKAVKCGGYFEYIM